MGASSLQLVPSLKFRFVMENHHAWLRVGEPATLTIPDLGASVPVFVTGLVNGTAGAKVTGTIDTSDLGSSSEMVEARFFVANLPDFLGETLREDLGAPLESFWAGRLALVGGDWQITLDERRDYKAVFERLKDQGGFEVTHTAALRRTDGQPFTGVEARDVLHALAGFLGFAAGAWATPLAAVGLDEHGTVAWREWNVRWTSPWQPRNYPFDDHKHDLSGAFAGYLQRWLDPIWNELLRMVTQMYVEANGPISADSTGVLGQAILEHIAWTLFVDDLHTYSAKDFNNPRLEASDRLRELLKWIEIDPAIPASLPALHQEGAGRWDDGPHAIVEMRNSLPHPKHRRRLTGTPTRARVELQELVLWYVELRAAQADRL